MVDILSYVHKYVPSKKNGDMLPVFFGGDQLTRERASGAQDAQLQASDRLGRLQGVIPKVEDWHALVIFYQVRMLVLECPCAVCGHVYGNMSSFTCVGPFYMCG